MKKLILIAIVGMFALTALAQGPRPGGGPNGGGGGGRGPAPNGRVEPNRGPDRGRPGVSDDLAKASAIVGMVTDTLRVFSGPPSPPPQPRVIVREPRVVVRQPAPVVIRESAPIIVQEAPQVVVPAPIIEAVPAQEVVVEKVVVKSKEIKSIEPIILNNKIYYKVIFTDGEAKVVEAK